MASFPRHFFHLVIYPKSPSSSSSGPAAKYNQFGLTDVALTGANEIPQSPSMTIGFPLCLSCPRKFPLASKALMRPSPKLPTSMIPDAPSSPQKVSGAFATPQGAFNCPRETNRLTKDPL